MMLPQMQFMACLGVLGLSKRAIARECYTTHTTISKWVGGRQPKRLVYPRWLKRAWTYFEAHGVTLTATGISIEIGAARRS